MEEAEATGSVTDGAIISVVLVEGVGVVVSVLSFSFASEVVVEFEYDTLDVTFKGTGT
eukprot:GDKH01007120.1.p1 GENE.GDKH01007120.1~~GDKH01007120.1.p1  ORF type:complete len:58 (-),score=4.05 GDKH01007120.1:140-313(-)